MFAQACPNYIYHESYLVIGSLQLDILLAFGSRYIYFKLPLTSSLVVYSPYTPLYYGMYSTLHQFNRYYTARVDYVSGSVFRYCILNYQSTRLVLLCVAAVDKQYQVYYQHTQFSKNLVGIQASYIK